MSVSALSNFPIWRQKISAVPRIVWGSRYDGSIALSAPYRVGSASDPWNNYFLDVTGTDSLGRAFADAANIYGPGATTHIQSITRNSINLADFSSNNSVVLEPSVMPGVPGNQLTITHIVGPTPEGGNITRPQTGLYLVNYGLNHVDILAWEIYFRLPANLFDILKYVEDVSNAHFMQLCGIKTSGFAGSINAGDYRVTLSVLKRSSPGRLVWRLQGDDFGNNATGSEWGVGGSPSPHPEYDLLVQNNKFIWSKEPTASNVPLNVPLVMKFYIKRPARNYIWIPGSGYQQDLTTGISRCVVQRVDTKEVVFSHDQLGGQQTGAYLLPLARHNIALLYTLGMAPSGPACSIEYGAVNFYDREFF
ncbi:hypothetical protein [Nitrosomonas oligotropha]|uniref:hypothetical protein n=1 Tax=Nitrosomonas oligotropha TaxID=42354 RepID=UPI0013695506|nr:hypothetical protein [Nitrosomonas oligotropha]MXS83972.1 hypothetical protein [Nitrosomonas oligotropha]